MNVAFSYSVIRYVGDPVRGEGTNIGVIVVSPDGETRVRTDPAASLRLERFWPHYDRGSVRTFVRDVEHRLAAQHQMRIEEEGSFGDGGRAEDVLAELSELSVNEIELSKPALHRGTDLEDVADALFRRFVWVPRDRQDKGRYLTRAKLRTMIHRILAEWAAARGLSIESDTEVKGALAPHQVDIVVRGDGEPDLIVLALPLRSQTAALIRDSLPTAVADMRAALPKTTFLTVLPDVRDESPASAPRNLDARTTRRFLEAEGLTVVGVSALLEHLRAFSPASRVPFAAEQGELPTPR